MIFSNFFLFLTKSRALALYDKYFAVYAQKSSAKGIKNGYFYWFRFLRTSITAEQFGAMTSNFNETFNVERTFCGRKMKRVSQRLQRKLVKITKK